MHLIAVFTSLPASVNPPSGLRQPFISHAPCQALVCVHYREDIHRVLLHLLGVVCPGRQQHGKCVPSHMMTSCCRRMATGAVNSMPAEHIAYAPALSLMFSVFGALKGHTRTTRTAHHSMSGTIHRNNLSICRRKELGVPVTLHMNDLPADGEVLNDFELTCDPEERLCKVRARIPSVLVYKHPGPELLTSAIMGSVTHSSMIYVVSCLAMNTFPSWCSAAGDAVVTSCSGHVHLQ